jgi:hypothetical protein
MFTIVTLLIVSYSNTLAMLSPKLPTKVVTPTEEDAAMASFMNTLFSPLPTISKSPSKENSSPVVLPVPTIQIEKPIQVEKPVITVTPYVPEPVVQEPVVSVNIEPDAVMAEADPESESNEVAANDESSDYVLPASLQGNTFSSLVLNFAGESFGTMCQDFMRNPSANLMEKVLERFSSFYSTVSLKKTVSNIDLTLLE